MFIYREIRGDSYRELAQYQELSEPFKVEHVPDESACSGTWRKRFDGSVGRFVQITAHFVGKGVHSRTDIEILSGGTHPAKRTTRRIFHSPVRHVFFCHNLLSTFVSASRTFQAVILEFLVANRSVSVFL
ncbi:hypothetical protein C5B91_19905 [Haloferax sp. Atlit-10N]|nr:hypothetical protein C5B91_19905 [Haloferax sp. Atlit-10N]